ncbi:hypothetical protein Barb6_02031 [Bacteroidales bacterium Barb6]|nr:hypothetical protein Barb6_02031 [Bacteroidales bacterium Barb6]
MEKMYGNLIWKAKNNIERVEVDEMHTYAGSRNCQWIQIAVDRTGKGFLDFVIGDRCSQTAGKFWNKIKHLL